MYIYVFKDIVVGGYLNSLEKYIVFFIIWIKFRILIYIYRSIVIGDEVFLVVCYIVYVLLVYVI